MPTIHGGLSNVGTVLLFMRGCRRGCKVRCLAQWQSQPAGNCWRACITLEAGIGYIYFVQILHPFPEHYNRYVLGYSNGGTELHVLGVMNPLIRIPQREIVAISLESPRTRVTKFRLGVK